MSEIKTNKKVLLNLFISFVKIGAFTFGGGYAMLPMITKEIIEKHHWITEEDLLDIFAISQVTPGVIAVNAATYVGYIVGKFWGSLLATIGVVLPSFATICVISYFLDAFMSIKLVEYAFYGIRMSVIVLMVMAVIKLGKADKTSLFYYIMMGAAFILATFTGFDVIIMLLCSAAVGIVVSLIKMKV